MKKLIAMTMALAMMLSLAACGSSNTPAETTPAETAPATQAAETQSAETAPAETAPAETSAASGELVEPTKTTKIGIEIYDPTDQEFLALKEYCDNYLADALNVEFVYSEAIADADGEIAFIDNCASAGCDGVIGYYNVTGAQAAWEAVDNGMYFVDCTASIYEELQDEELYLGSILYGENGDFAAGQAMGQYLAEQGCQKVIYSNGGADFGVEMFVNRQNGFLDGVGGAEVITVSGFPNADSFPTDQNAALTTEGVDGVATAFNAMAGWAQPIQAAGMDIPVATIGVVGQDFVDALNSGMVDMVVAGNIERWALPITMIYQAVNGEKILDDNGAAPVVNQAWLTFDSGDDMAAYLEIMNTAHIYNGDEIKGCTTYQQLTDLAASFSLEDVQARRAG